MFKCGKKPIDVAIELDISASEIEDVLQEYWVLIWLDELALVYYNICYRNIVIDSLDGGVSFTLNP